MLLLAINTERGGGSPYKPIRMQPTGGYESKLSDLPWLPLLCAALVAAVVVPALMVWSPDGEIFYALLIEPLLTLIALLPFACLPGRRLLVLASLLVYWAASFLFLHYAYDERVRLRWILGAREYKAALMSQPDPPAGQLRHLYWDTWGLAGQATFAFLVYDPGDSLVDAAARGAGGKLPGMPCEIPARERRAGLRRLEPGWYSVVTYTNTTWDECPPPRGADR